MTTASRSTTISTRPERAQATPRFARRKLGTTTTALLFVAPFFLLYALFLIWPTFNQLLLSFTNKSLAGTGGRDFLGLSNYAEVFGDTQFWNSILHTLYFTLLTTPPLVILGFGLAVLANRRIPAKWAFRLAFFAPYVLPVSVVAMIWSWLFQPGFGLIDSTLTSLGLPSVQWLSGTNTAMIAIAVATVWWTLGFNFVLYMAGLQEIPHVLYEAADIDGAGEWGKLWHITVPNLSRTHVLVLVLQVLASLKIFAQVYLMTNGGPNDATRVALLNIYDVGFTQWRIGYAAAMSVVFFVIVLIASVGQFLLLRGRRTTGASS